MRKGGTYDLAIIDDAGVNNFVSNYARLYFGAWSQVWIGLTDIGYEGKFHWVDHSEPKSTSWHKGEPNNEVIKIYTCLIAITAIVSIFIYAIAPGLD